MHMGNYLYITRLVFHDIPFERTPNILEEKRDLQKKRKTNKNINKTTTITQFFLNTFRAFNSINALIS